MLEILAPCAGEDTVEAALKYGADAVYLGVTEFSARKNADNFTLEQLEKIIRKCRFLGVRVYLALNTLIFDEELQRLFAIVDKAAGLGIDGVIIQDLCLLSYIKEHYPALPVHGSTQMSVTSVRGARLVKELGFDRIVLARELSFSEIREITSAVDIETEIFVHGALCVSLSGQCYLSSFLGGRSGNRGYCAQPCRLPFSAGEQSHALSLKDMSIIEQIPKIAQIGVTSVKIEGRMKPPQYVACAVNACYMARAGERPDLQSLEAAFSRSGFTSGYFDGNLSNMGGIRQKEDVLAYLSFKGEGLREVVREYPVDIEISIKRNLPAVCIFRYKEIAAEVFGDIPQEARTRSLTGEIVAEQIAKLGGTHFVVRKIAVETDENLFLPLGSINALRRSASELLTDRIIHCLTTKLISGFSG